MIKIQKLFADAILPTRGTDKSAGLDLYAYLEGEITIEPGETKKIGSGIAVACPEGTFGAVFARSGLATKQGLRPANCVGVVDEDYTGEVIVALHNDSNEARVIKPQDRIAQLVFIPYRNDEIVEVRSLEPTDRGDGGFGSTGE